MADPMKPSFEPLNDLERLLVVAMHDPSQRTVFTNALLASDVFAITHDSGIDGKTVLKAGEEVGIVKMMLPDLGLAIPLFTAPSRIAEAYGDGRRYLSMNGRALLELVRPSRIVLNPGLSYGVMWAPEEVEGILGTPQARVLDRTESVMLGVPKREPEDLMFTLRTAFQPIREITGAWLAIAKWPDSADMTWFLDVRTKAPRDQISSVYAAAVKDADLAGMPIDMAIRDPGDPPGIGLEVVSR